MEHQVGKNFINTKGLRVARKGKRIFLEQYSRPSDVGVLIRHIRDIFKNPETKTLILYVQQKFRVFPNQIVPLACIIKYLRQNGKKVILHNELEDIKQLRFDEPIISEWKNIQAQRQLAGVVWEVASSEQCYALVDGIISELSYSAKFGSGVLRALEWSLNEIIDNVLIHSNATSALLMYQLQLNAGKISFSVGDAGRGFLSSFEQSTYQPKTEIDAITLAVKKDVTRDPTIGAGNGLWGTVRIVGENGGRLTIASGGSAVFFRTDEGEIKSYDNLGTIDSICKSSLVDLQISITNPVRLAVAFQQSENPVSLFFEKHELDNGDTKINLRNWRYGTGTRESGKNARIFIINLLENNPGQIVINFDGLGIISSSFADELFVKLNDFMGNEEFGRRVAVTGLSDVTRMIIAGVLKKVAPYNKR